MTRPTTLITGAAKRIGAAIARHLAAQGHDLVLHYGRSRAEAAALKTELEALGATVALKQWDLAATEALTDFWQGLPPCTGLIHNASQYGRDRLADMTAAGLRTHLAVNLEAPLLLSQGFLKQLPPSAPGNVIFLGDGTQGWSISPEFFSYAVSKFAFGPVVDVLAAALAPRARANVLALAPTLPNDGEAAMFARLAQKAPLKRVSTPDEVMMAIDFLFASPGVTGQVISLAGGMGLATVRP